MEWELEPGLSTLMELLGLERGGGGRQVQAQEWADVEAHPWHMPKF